MRLKLHHQILIAMLLGAGIGLPLNILAQKTLRFTLPPDMRILLVEGTINRSLLNALQHERVELADDARVSVINPDQRWTIEDTEHSLDIRRVGEGFGVYVGRVPQRWPQTIAHYGKGVGDVFLRLLSMIVTPLILVSLVSGVTSSGSLKGLGRLGTRTMVYYMSTSLIAIVTGILVFNVVNPGRGSNLEALTEGATEATTRLAVADQGLGATLWDQLFNLIPSNPFSAMADPSNKSVLGVIFFALLFGVFITVTGGETAKFLTKAFNGAFEVMMRMTMAIIRLAPIGVLGFMLYAAAGSGLDVFRALGWYVLTVAVALSIHALITLPLLILLLARRSPWSYFKAMSPALLTAFSTASSNGTLPLSMTCIEKRAGISNRISAFVMPLGATINMDGTALYEAVAVLFIAQVTGHELGLAQQVIVAFTALLASVGAAGIPHAGTVMMVVVLGAVGLPIDYVGIILAVDRVLDMYRTSVNVWSDSIACAVVSRFEGVPVASTNAPLQSDTV